MTTDTSSLLDSSRSLARSVSPCPCRIARAHAHGFIMEGDARWGMYLAALRDSDGDRWLDVALGLEDGGTVALRVWLSEGRVRTCILEPAECDDHPALVLGYWMSERVVLHEVPELLAVMRSVLSVDARLRRHLANDRSRSA